MNDNVKNKIEQRIRDYVIQELKEANFYQNIYCKNENYGSIFHNYPDGDLFNYWNACIVKL